MNNMFSYFLHFKITLKNLLSNLKKSFSTVYIVIYIINKTPLGYQLYVHFSEGQDLTMFPRPSPNS